MMNEAQEKMLLANVERLVADVRHLTFLVDEVRHVTLLKARRAQTGGSASPASGSPSGGVRANVSEGQMPLSSEFVLPPLEQKEGLSTKDSAIEATDIPPSAPLTVQQLWNKLADPCLPRAQSMNATRAVKARRLLRDHTEKEIEDAIAAMNVDQFCLGTNTRGWKADIDWFLRPNTVSRLLEKSTAQKPDGFFKAGHPRARRKGGAA